MAPFGGTRLAVIGTGKAYVSGETLNSAASRSKRWIAVGAVAAAVLLLLLTGFVLIKVLGGSAVTAAPSLTPSATASPSPTGPVTGLKIGVLGALSGDNADLFTPIRNGAELAIDEYNEKHPDAPVTLATFDSQGDRDKAPAAALQAVNDEKVVAVIGPGFSAEVEATGGIFETAQLPILVPMASRTSLGANGWRYFHRGVASDVAQGIGAARYIRDVLKASKVFTVEADWSYAEDFIKGATQGLSGLVVGAETITDGQTSFPDVVTGVTDSGATVVVFGGYSDQAGPLLKQLRAKGWRGTLVGGDGIRDDEMLAAGRSVATGTVAVCPCAPPISAGTPFAQAYKAKFKALPGYGADVAYDLAATVLQGIDAGSASRAGLQDWLASARSRGSASGVTYAWEATGELRESNVALWTYRAHNGGWVPDRRISMS